MKPGPIIIRKCSACSGQVQERTLASGNTMGAIYWTDGKCEAPMLPAQKRLGVCPHCQALVWTEKLEILGLIDPWAIADSQYKNALDLNFATIEQYIRALGLGVAPPEEEYYLRLQAWWAGNDSRRSGSAELPLTTLEIANLTVLVQILDESDRGSLVMKSEALRELGRFEEAIELLNRAASSKLTPAVETILGLAKKQDPSVRRFCF